MLNQGNREQFELELVSVIREAFETGLAIGARMKKREKKNETT
jgi:hypothetical protein